jgi:hypothetical protein
VAGEVEHLLGRAVTGFAVTEEVDGADVASGQHFRQRVSERLVAAKNGNSSSQQAG